MRPGVRFHVPGDDAMRKLMWIGLGLAALAAVWKFEEEEDGTAIALSPFLAALAIAILVPRRRPLD
ncbi:MAG TPA: hypothetical protein VLT91_13695 [Rhizomicrobium sp.]|nr:hypothetical protein [Rhizomicrobium sp.]